jgi:hypothetical protein
MVPFQRKSMLTTTGKLEVDYYQNTLGVFGAYHHAPPEKRSKQYTTVMLSYR